MATSCFSGQWRRRRAAAQALHTAIFNPGSLTLLLYLAQRQNGELFRKPADMAVTQQVV